jgi:IS605 OrfB family transposase
MKLTTYRFRLKDSSCRNRLRKLGFGVNDIWNYCNERNAYQWAFRRKLLSAFDLHKLTTGAGKELGLHSQTVQAVVDEYCKCGKQFKRPKLNWRSRKRSLGWIPFKAVGVKVGADTVTYGGQPFRFWNSRPLPGKVRFGSFAEDAQGRWYVNFVCEDLTPERKPRGKEAGVDMGLKTIATLSDGVALSRENLTKKFEVKLAVAQRARKKKQVTRIHARIKNKRKDWNHKTTTLLTNEYDVLVVGNVSSSKLKKTTLAKSVSDAGWADFKQMLSYKSLRLGISYLEVNESFSTVTCSVCSERTGPRGLSALGVRSWRCSSCEAEHDRDRNAAANILASARDILRQRESRL